MGAILVRLALLAGGLGLGQMGLDSFAHGAGVAVVQFGLALVLLVAGSASFIVPLLGGSKAQEVTRHV
jgi:predicted lipid-binding transport protein (Tim44 family)